MVDVKTWMDMVHFKLNSSETEFIFFESRDQLTKCTIEVLNVKMEN